MRLLLAAVAIAWTAPVAASGEEVAPVQEVLIVRDGDRWTAEFTFLKDAAAWAFQRSAVTRKETVPWRPLSWRIETPGVELKRLGFYDALVAKSGTVPRKVRISFEPFADDLRADYDPALAFTDGSVALYTGHYDAVPMAAPEAVAKLPIDLGSIDLADDSPARLTFVDRSGEVLHGGVRKSSARVTGDHGYVLFGQARTVEAPAITTILDPQLPGWLTAELAGYTPRLLDFYAQKLGPQSGPKPTVMVSWAGATPGVQSMGGSVLPGLIVMRMEGEAVTVPNRAVERSARWFIAHESAHFWAGQTIGYRSPTEMWITEGGADLLAVRAAAALDPEFDAVAELNKSLDGCVLLAAKGPMATAGERNEHNVHYWCGAMFGLAAEAAESKAGGDFFTFWRKLIDDNRADETIDRAEWLSQLTRSSGSPAAARIISSMLDSPTPEATEKLAALFDSTGVRYRKDPDGKIRLL